MKKSPKTLAETFLEAVTAAYPADPSTPGMVISFLGPKKGYYVSLVRYSKPHGEGKCVTLKARQPSLDEALVECAGRWFAMYAPAESAIRSLKKALKDRGVTLTISNDEENFRAHARTLMFDPDDAADAAEEATWD